MSKKKKIILASLTAFVLLLAALCAYAVYTVNAFDKTGKIIDNMQFCGIDIGGKTVKEAAALINESENLPALIPVTVEYEGKSFSFSPNGAGISYDIESIVKNAHNMGREGSFFKDLRAVMSSEKIKEAEPVYKEDKESFATTIDTLVKDSQIHFEDYKVSLKETYAEIEIGEDRKQVDFDKLIEDTYEIILKPAEERKLTLPVKQAEALNADEIYNNIYVEPRNASTGVVNGKTTLIPHQVGILLDKNEIVNGINSGENKFRVKIRKKYPEVRSEHLNSTLFGDVLAACKTNYNINVTGRSKNVSLAADKINGVILNPGDVFSYNNVVGPRTSSAGFENATVYTSAGLEEGLGGGICQVSSTLYNAALYADLKIVERRNHTYTVGYVKNGLDATVAYGAIDFKFSNNKSSPIKVIAGANGGVLTISIMGKKENNNKIELYTNTLETYEYETKEIVNETLNPGERNIKQDGSKGYKITASKVVKNSSGEIIRNESLGTSVYKPITRIVEIGPGEAPVSTAPIPSENEKESLPTEDEGQVKEETKEEITENNIDENNQQTDNIGTKESTDKNSQPDDNENVLNSTDAENTKVNNEPVSTQNNTTELE